MTIESPQGQMIVTANYKHEGETLTGTHVSEMGEAPLKGTVKRADIEYTISLDMGGQQLTIVHKGKVDGDTITGSAIVGEMGAIAFRRGGRSSGRTADLLRHEAVGIRALVDLRRPRRYLTRRVKLSGVR
jgi:hypothetical protein